VPTYPHTPAKPEPNEIGGIAFSDAHQWLEDGDDAAVQAWEDEQNALTDRLIRSWAGYEPLRALVDRHSVDSYETPPARYGAIWFRQRTPDGRSLAVAEVAPTVRGPWRTLVDLEERSTGSPLMMQVTPSRDGSRAIVAISEAGSEEPHVQVLDVATGAVLLDGLPQQRVYLVEWLPDGSGFLYSAQRSPEEHSWAIYRHVLGEAPPTTPEVTDLPHPVGWAKVGADGTHAVVLVDHLRPRPVLLLDLQDPAATWQPFITDAGHMYKGTVTGGAYLCVTDRGAPRGRLVSIPLDAPDDEQRWTELVPGSDAVLVSANPMGARIVLGELVDTVSRLRILDRDGTEVGRVPLPGDGTVAPAAHGTLVMGFMDHVIPCPAPAGSGEPDAITFAYQSFDASSAPYHCTLDSLQVEALAAPAVVLDGVRLHPRAATSTDGTAVPYVIAAAEGVDLTVPRPTLVYGYGGFNIAHLPVYHDWAAAWIAAGGVVVNANLRGGGEFGISWWEQGRMHAKQTTFDDLYAIAEQLLADGVASRETLAVMGGSNGGLLTGAALVQRPDLWAAIVSRVPILDLLRVIHTPVSMGAMVSDYGNPADPADAAVLRRISPYHNVEAGVRYPAVLFDAGRNDPRCPAWHARKMAAAVQTATTGEAPVLLRVWAEGGHGTADRSLQIRQTTDWLAFAMQHTGLSPA
jgi:prolyl oligopeptidase